MHKPRAHSRSSHPGHSALGGFSVRIFAGSFFRSFRSVVPEVPFQGAAPPGGSGQNPTGGLLGQDILDDPLFIRAGSGVSRRQPIDACASYHGPCAEPWRGIAIGRQFGIYM
ncbi:hypothetical protein AB838_17885 [Rhodobacteraceae bacterium (ex Bugula neritina AB1)]|nr:hypothetical protein AB838_17885 [Rhodobacteraceae bacterium (ex Bugula neritina AB1)]